LVDAGGRGGAAAGVGGGVSHGAAAWNALAGYRKTSDFRLHSVRCVAGLGSGCLVRPCW